MRFSVAKDRVVVVERAAAVAAAENFEDIDRRRGREVRGERRRFIMACARPTRSVGSLLGRCFESVSYCVFQVFIVIASRKGVVRACSGMDYGVAIE